MLNITIFYFGAGSLTKCIVANRQPANLSQTDN